MRLSWANKLTICAKAPSVRTVLNSKIALFENHPAQPNEFNIFIPIPDTRFLLKMLLDSLESNWLAWLLRSLFQNMLSINLVLPIPRVG